MIAPAANLSSLVDVSESIRQRRLSPVELVRSCLARIERLQPQLNAFATVLADAALEAAATAEHDIQHERWRGPLHGVPVGIKDFYDTAGVATTAAFEHFRRRVPSKDAHAVEQLKRAGAIVIGKMNMHTLGMGTTGLESCFGPVRNPCNAGYIPGGSSSGSAAAIAAGLCYATLDTDAIGSCRLPAACCGVVGYKGSFGLIDMQGILEGEQPPDETIRWLAHAGITTRSVQDTALVLDVLAQPADGHTGSCRTVIDAKRALRVGVANNVKAAADVTNAFASAVATLRRLAHAVSETPAPFVDFSRGIANIEADREAIGRLAFSEVDVLVLPTTITATPTVDAAANNATALSPELTMFANYYGLPAVSVPCGVDSCGLPVGLQFVARHGDDGAVLQLAAEFEHAAPGAGL